jgi:hypothetical protein
MIGMKMVPASTGGWGDGETGTCSWGRAAPAYHLGRWNCLTRLSTPLPGPPGWRPCSLNARVGPGPLANLRAWSPPSAQGRDQGRDRKMIGHPGQRRSLRHRRAATDGRRSGPGLIAVKCAKLKLWWKTRHARAAYRRLFDDVPPRKRPLKGRLPSLRQSYAHAPAVFVPSHVRPSSQRVGPLTEPSPNTNWGNRPWRHPGN